MGTTTEGSSSAKGSSSGLTRTALLVLGFLALQNCVKNIVMRAAVRGEAQFLYSAAVIATEALKCVASAAWVLAIDGGSLTSIVTFLAREWKRTVLLAVPAAIYNFQKTLEYVALSNLNAAVFAVLVQTKLFTTAICAVALMSKSLRKAQVISLILLTVGCVLAQLDGGQAKKCDGDEAASTVEDTGNKFIGVVATLLISFSSGFASVYTEKVIKAADKQRPPPPTPASGGVGDSSSSSTMIQVSSSSSGSSSSSSLKEDAAVNGLDDRERGTVTLLSKTLEPPPNTKPTYGLAYTQIQLAVASLVIEGAWAAATDFAKIQKNGLWYGFGWNAWLAVSMTALGGIAVAAVLKFADAILKGYATAISVVLTGLASHLLFGTTLNIEYGLGMVNVLAALILYNSTNLDMRAF
mmetsp:Transcript_4133/g.13589  ORF Transcript_4133/g.13589 Transcript_4133/m.13589 type:complete len:410 (+) Transcript_4133:120-1349(+)|eukprot:CAMPEP_0118911430 /NCGR_PEP_ID=MMETSP1166-20130328/13127_1 /TAXON_ID=1104430 /ORGANISM="Chrysoreinhardia sp, Strain CCMP3193" /LENGTH=409 /DNA_ID=CAMNT_0006850915 /DNA_START=59 /DNA_END=1288 /DNA_ORIENTATION=-